MILIIGISLLSSILGFFLGYIYAFNEMDKKFDDVYEYHTIDIDKETEDQIIETLYAYHKKKGTQEN